MTESSPPFATIPAHPAGLPAPAGSGAAGSAAAAADGHLRQFCESAVELLQAGAAHGSVLSHVLPSLVRILGECGPGAVAQLREEMRTWEVASEQLTQLACIHCGDEAAGLLTRLEHARGHAARVIDALAGIQAALPLPPVVRQPDPGELREHRPDEPRLSDREQAGALFRKGQKLHQTQDFDAAETAYADALRLDGELRLAYLHRGRIRLMRGRLEAAIEDFSQSLRLDPSDPLAYGWRADAGTLLGRHETAISDYNRALELRPDLALVRYNRAVALRQAGRWDAAFAEFQLLATLRPAHAPIFLNRGLIHKAQGRLDAAAQDFRTALRHQPDSREALQNLLEIEPLLASRPMPEAAVAEPAVTEPAVVADVARLQPQGAPAELLRVPRQADRRDLEPVAEPTPESYGFAPNVPQAPVVQPVVAPPAVPRAAIRAPRERHSERPPDQRREEDTAGGDELTLNLLSFPPENSSDDEIAMAALATPLADPLTEIPELALLGPVANCPTGPASAALPSTPPALASLDSQSGVTAAGANLVANGASGTNAVSAADRFQLNFQCPACGSTAIVRLDRMQLGKVLGCPNCRRKFTNKESGRLVEVVKDPQGRWKEKPERVHSIDAKRILAGAGAILLICALYWAPRLWPVSPPAHDADMPTDLQPRAELFAWAWLKGDFRTMKILTDEKQGELLFDWYMQNPAPQVRSQHTLEKDVKLYVQVPPGEDNPTVLNVRIDGLRSRGGKTTPELSLAWEQQRRGVWKFLPTPPMPL